MPHADLPPLSREEREEKRRQAEAMIAREVEVGMVARVTMPCRDLLRLLAQLDAVTPTDEAIWTDEQCFALNAAQHDRSRHPYTCGNDSRHRPLIATRFGWRCANCDYKQNWAHVMCRIPTPGEGE